MAEEILPPVDTISTDEQLVLEALNGVDKLLEAGGGTTEMAKLINEFLDTKLINITRRIMANKLKAQRNKGFKWWWKAEVTTASLKERLYINYQEGNFLNVAILASMIHFRTLAGIE